MFAVYKEKLLFGDSHPFSWMEKFATFIIHASILNENTSRQQRCYILVLIA